MEGLYPILILMLIGVVFFLLKEKFKEEKVLQDCQEELKKAKEKVDELGKFQQIIDAQSEADRIIKEARISFDQTASESRRIKEKANRRMDEIYAQANTDAKVIRSDAKNRADKIKEKADSIMGEARSHAEKVRTQARVDAEKIAGDALEAKEKAGLWESVARAARNAIKGYGDEYILPAQSLLDGLAEDFSHKDAGQKLKEARSHTKMLIKKKVAAVCDYAENGRRKTAIRFVLDAYTGKVESILSKVKRDNYGKLRQQVEDAFQLVNYNGSAFRNARITDEFHISRLDELQWAAAATELQMLEREEQRQIKEQMREEERARREYEKAIKDAEKEEKMLQKAMAQVRVELDVASEGQRQEYEQQLAELEEKLAGAESRNERAISMAQQTRRGHVYVISNIGSFGGNVYKVGMTRRLEPLDRVRELGDASVPFGFDVHAMIYSENAPSLEKELHRKFAYAQVNKVNPRKEFFRVSLSDIREVVEEVVEEVEDEVHWTMTAEACEYRETHAIEQALKEGKKLEEAAPELVVH